MLRPLEEECSAAGMVSRPGTGMPAVPRSPLDADLHLVQLLHLDASLGQSDWRISPYETNPPKRVRMRLVRDSSLHAVMDCHASTAASSIRCILHQKHLWRPWGASAFDWAVQCMPAEAYFNGQDCSAHPACIWQICRLHMRHKKCPQHSRLQDCH